MSNKHILGLGLGAALSLAFAPGAFATGVDAGVNITNTATVDYKVGTVDQPQEISTTDNFEVDRRILFTVAATDGNEIVPPNAQDQALSFVVQNDTNGAVDFYLSVVQDGADDFDGSGAVAYYLDDGDGVFEPGVGAGLDGNPITYLDNVPEYDGTAATQRIVHVVYDIPASPTVASGDLANVTLTLQATPDGSVAATPYTEAASDTAGTVDTVLADGTGVSDADRDGLYSATDTYEVQSADITVTKTSRIVTDPINCTIDGDSTSCGANTPKRIPGAVVQYCITVENAGGAAADSVTISDGVPAGTTYVTSSIWTNVTGATTTCDLTDTLTAAGNLQSEDDNATDGDESDPAGGSFAAGTVTVQLEPSVPATTGLARAAFRVTID